MFKIFFYLVLVLVFGGCVGTAQPEVKPNQKVFEDEDAYILFALRAEQLRDCKNASKIFDRLYEKSDKKEYLYRSLKNSLVCKENQKVVEKVDGITHGKIDDFVLIRMKIIALMELEKFTEAKTLALELVGISKEADDYILLSDIYIKLKRYDTALKYLESAYVRDYNEKILDKMSIILYLNLERKKDAIAQLETHTRVHGCSELICMRLIAFYSNENNIDGLLSTYLRLYKIDKNDEISKRIIQIYGYKKEYLELIDFLQESGSDDDLLLQLYTNTKNYKKASPLADKLYKMSGDINYLGQSAIFDYESTADKNDKSMQKRVMAKLEKVVKAQENPLYLNYLGYLLIDHKLDIKQGIKYVKRALKIEPNSAYYLDSLAWGYYRLGDYEKAYKILKKVTKLDGGDDKEVLSHLKEIKKHIKNKGKNKK
jgi:tetratricopeptide (TPR) repeat protein